jgi:hypothetical protein
MIAGFRVLLPSAVARRDAAACRGVYRNVAGEACAGSGIYTMREWRHHSLTADGCQMQDA